MGLFDFLIKGFKSKNGLEVIAPSQTYPNQIDAIAHVIQSIETDGWATFVANDGSEDLIIQTTCDSINLCREVADVIAIAKNIGLRTLAEAIVQENRSVYLLPSASPHEIAEVVHAIYVNHFRLPADYRLEGRLGDY